MILCQYERDKRKSDTLVINALTHTEAELGFMLHLTATLHLSGSGISLICMELATFWVL